MSVLGGRGRWIRRVLDYGYDVDFGYMNGVEDYISHG